MKSAKVAIRGYNKDLPTGRGVGHLHRLQGRILPYTNSQSVQEVHAFSHPGSFLPVQSPTLWPVHSTHGSSLLRTRLACERGEVRTGSQTCFQLRRLPVRPHGGQGQTHTRALADLNR